MFTLNEHLKEKRLELGLSRMAVAKKMGYSTDQFIYNYEAYRCKPPYNKISKICDVLEVDPNEFIERALYDFEGRLNEALHAN